MLLTARSRTMTILAAGVLAVTMIVALDDTGAHAKPSSGESTQLTKSAIPAASRPTAKAPGRSGQLLERATPATAATEISSEAFEAAGKRGAALPAAKGRWSEVTTKPYNVDAPGYRDPFWSNGGAGAGVVSGRMTAITSVGDVVYAGAANGGVWKSRDKGAHWQPIFDNQKRLSVGALATDPADKSLWVGTGEATSASPTYAGNGIYRSANGGRSWRLVGNRLPNSLVSRITFDGEGHVYAATSRGLLRRNALDRTAAWTTVLKPDPNPEDSPYRTSWMSDVRVRPGTHGQYVVAVVGWGHAALADSSYNGFYVSTAAGATGTWQKMATPGITDTIGRTSLDYTPDGSRLFAVIENPDTEILNGVYRSDSGTAAGPWQLIADDAELAATPNNATDHPGNVAWYDQYVTVDPSDPTHIYLGLTEVFESSDSGDTWTTIAPYSNFSRPCWNIDPAKDTCPGTTHFAQQAAWVSSDGIAYFATDGGMYSRPALLRKAIKWNNLNATLRTLQYYSVGVGKWPTGGDAIWGGLDANGVSLLEPGAAEMVSPFGNYGGDVIVDPHDARRAVNEFAFLEMARTENGGRSDGTTRSYTNITPTCFAFAPVEFHPDPCDPRPAVIPPFEADPTNVNHWVAGGQKVWDNQGAGWNTVCNDTSCDWKPVRDLGAGVETRTVAVSGTTIYAGWCGGGCSPGGSAPFTSGIDTNYGGTWHRVNAPNLPNRVPTAFDIDSADPSHVFVTFGAFSRRWIPGGGVGHVFESWNGGASWTDRSGNLPDIPVNDVVVVHGNLVVGTDTGVFVTTAKPGSTWRRLGTNLPHTATTALDVAPDRSYLLAATHGRGIWRIPVSG